MLADAAAETTATQPCAGVSDQAAGTTATQPGAGVSDQAARSAASADAGPMCVICQDRLMSEQSRLAMPCGHAFHEECVRKYAECKQIPLEEACPMRCHRSVNDLNVTMDEMRGGPAAITPRALDDEFSALVDCALQNVAGVS